MIATDPRIQQLDELSQYAYRLGCVFGAAAERAEDPGRQLEYVQLFDRCFFSVRVAIALELRLRREPLASRPASRVGREDLSIHVERDPSEREPREDDAAGRDAPERFAERDRERERETASLPLLLRTLSAVVTDAATLPGPEPSALPSLRELLARITSVPTGETPITPRPIPRPSGTGLRARLAGSTTAPVMTLPSRARPPAGFALPARRATGPPWR